MKKLAKRTEKVERSKTLSVTAKANELKAKGEDIVVLTVGEPDFPTPDNIKKAGWYLQAGFLVIPEKLQGVLKFDTYDRNTSIPNNSNRVSTIGANIFFDEKSRLQLGYEFKDEQGGEKINNSFIAQLQFGF